VTTRPTNAELINGTGSFFGIGRAVYAAVTRWHGSLAALWAAVVVAWRVPRRGRVYWIVQ